MRFRRRLSVVALIAGLIFEVLAAMGADGSVSLHAEHEGRATTRIVWRSCGVQLQCAHVRVPLDWRHPRGPTTSLPVIRHLASRPTQRIGSLFVNGGGALGSVEQVRTDGAQLDALGQGRFDVVGWTLRSDANATPMVRCFRTRQSRERFWHGLSIPTTRAQSLAYARKIAGYARRCARLSGSLLRHVSTTDDARDLDRLRRLVDDRRLTYSALSYGTFLGQTYANMFPQRVRAMVLDGLVDPRLVIRGAAARFSNTVVAMDRGLRWFESLCQRAGPARCALAGRDPVAARVAQLRARLRRAPIPAPTAKPRGALTYSDLSTVLFASLTNPAAWPELARDLEKAADGDGSALATRSRAVLAGTRSVDGPTSLTCTDSPARQGLDAWPQVIARLTRVSNVGGAFIGWSGWAPCASWPAHSADRYAGRWNRTTENPILVVGTTFDPATPYSNALRVVKLLGNAILLTHDGYGHTSEADPSACVTRVQTSYLVQLHTPRPGTTCPSDRAPFEPRFGKPHA